jgi:hypothetical protein
MHALPQKRGIEDEIKVLRAEHQLEKENVLAQYRALLQEVSSQQHELLIATLSCHARRQTPCLF